MKKSTKNILVWLSLVCVVVFLTGCPSKVRPVKMEVVKLPEVGNISVDLVAVPHGMVETIRSMNVDEWFDNPTGGLRQSFKEKGLLRVVPEKFSLDKRSPEWKGWLETKGVTHLVVLADLNRQAAKTHGGDIRRKVIDLMEPEYYKANLIKVEVMRDSIMVTIER